MTKKEALAILDHIQECIVKGQFPEYGLVKNQWYNMLTEIRVGIEFGFEGD